MSDDLLWVTEAEKPAIVQLHAALTDAFPDWLSYPADMTHDLHLCRFLRGNNGDQAQTLAKLRVAISYRKELIGREEFASLRKSVGASTRLDLTLLPNASEVLRILPILSIEGSSVDGLPAVITLARFADYDAFNAFIASEGGPQKLSDFLSGMLEQRALILHNRSITEGRMVKFVDVRDLNGMSVTEFLSKGRSLFATMKQDTTPTSYSSGSSGSSNSGG